MFYEYSQNNSGGSFHYDESAGISHFVLVEANSTEEADARAEDIGVYFNGVDDGRDCECCGDRWSSNSGWYASRGSEEPEIYGKVVDFNAKYEATSEYAFKWIDGYEAFVHYADGTVKGAYAS